MAWHRLGFLFRHHGQGEIKSGAAVQFAFAPSFSAMAGDDAADVGQADARAFKIFRAMQPLENAEEFMRILHVEADTSVFYEEDYSIAIVLVSNINSLVINC